MHWITWTILAWMGAAGSGADAVYAPLWLYQGEWEVTPKGLAAGGKPDHLSNACARIGKHFGCEQTVNGKIVALVIFVPAEAQGHYYTQALMPDGHAQGRGELEIQGDRWTFLGKGEDGGKTTYFRTTNLFTGKDRIHFEQAQSNDGEHWTVGGSGDERRLASGH